MSQEPIIVARNKDVEHIVNAAANYGHYSGTKPKDPRFTLLCAADIHHSLKQIANMVDYLNYMPAIDAAIHLGDQIGLVCLYVSSDGCVFGGLGGLGGTAAGHQGQGQDQCQNNCDNLFHNRNLSFFCWSVYYTAADPKKQGEKSFYIRADFACEICRIML